MFMGAGAIARRTPKNIGFGKVGVKAKGLAQTTINSTRNLIANEINVARHGTRRFGIKITNWKRYQDLQVEQYGNAFHIVESDISKITDPYHRSIKAGLDRYYGKNSNRQIGPRVVRKVEAKLAVRILELENLEKIQLRSKRA